MHSRLRAPTGVSELGRMRVFVCASTFILVCIFMASTPTILESATLRNDVRRSVGPLRDKKVHFDNMLTLKSKNFDGTASATFDATRHTGPRTTISLSCKSKMSAGASCQFPLNKKLLPDGSTVECIPASYGDGVSEEEERLPKLPWCVVVCGSSSMDKDECTLSQQGDRLQVKSAIVGIHGGPGQSSGIIRDLVRLASNTLPVILYDQRGAGRSASLPSPVGKSIDDTMTNYVEELEQIVKYFGVESVHLVGHSFGAAIAIKFAQRFPSLVSSISLLSPTIDGTWWQEDADFHRDYLSKSAKEPAFPRGDEAASEELLKRWVLGSALSVSDIEPLMCSPNGDVYNTIWGSNEDVVDGQTANLHLADILQSLSDIPVLLGCGVLDEAPPKRMLDVAKLLNGGTEDISSEPKRRVQVIVLPHSSHIILESDWGYYIDALRRHVMGSRPVPITVPPPKPISSGFGYSDMYQGKLDGQIKDSELEQVHETLLAMQDSLRALEGDNSVVRRSYPYLGRLLTLKQAPPNGFRQMEHQAMIDLIGGEESIGGLDWDTIQAVVDVWYVASIIDTNRIHDPALRPPNTLLNTLARQMRSAYRNSASPVDRIMYYVVGKSLDRLGVDGAPNIPPYEWRHLASEIDMKKRYPAIYMYLLTHVYIYNTDFGTIPVHQTHDDGPQRVPPSLMTEIMAATDELVEMMPLALEPRGAQRIYNGMITGNVVSEDTKYDLICELFFTMVRVYGTDHPVSAMLAVRVQSFLSRRKARPELDAESGHFLAVCLASWVVWEGAPNYI